MTSSEKREELISLADDLGILEKHVKVEKSHADQFASGNVLMGLMTAYTASMRDA